MSVSPLRPRSVAAMREALANLISDESALAADLIEVHPSDLFIVTYPKSGTTWLQQVVHGLKSGGAMDFDEICEVVPWLETALDLGIDVTAPQAGGFRAFKSHRTAEAIQRGGRYLVCLRHPEDVLVSFYRFFEGWMFEPGSIDLDTFAVEFFLQGSGSGRYWDHLGGWWMRRDDPHTLLLCFEDLHTDLGASVDHIAAFLGIPLPPALRETVVAQSTFAFMSAHAARFDDHLLRDARDAACGLPTGASGGKIGRGKVGEGAAVLSDAVRRQLAERWAAEVTPVTGCEDYPALRRRLSHLRERR